jgi:lysyl-tRNA synthetase class II
MARAKHRHKGVANRLNSFIKKVERATKHQELLAAHKQHKKASKKAVEA